MSRTVSAPARRRHCADDGAGACAARALRLVSPASFPPAVAPLDRHVPAPFAAHCNATPVSGSAHFVAAHGHGDGWNLSFAEPCAVHVAERLDQLAGLFARAQAAADDGRWVALAVAYEAAPAFDSALAVRAPRGSASAPLAWAAEYRAPSPTPSSIAAAGQGDYRVGEWRSQLPRDDYLVAIARIREYIRAGDCYQVNFTFPLRADFSGDARRWFADLCRSQRAGYGAYLDLGRQRLLSLSPELFFARRGGRLYARPMKGTAPPGSNAAETRAAAAALAASEKDRAENLMIVDLLRNDLSRVAATGTVRVPRLFEIEHYPTVLQMTSSIEADCAPDADLWTLFRALFPCGSISGAPKVRSMQIIAELECAPRGFYCGAIGYLAPGGDCAFNVPIRTVQLDVDSGSADYGTGSGVTWGSLGDAEYDECLLKTRFLHAATGC